MDILFVALSYNVNLDFIQFWLNYAELIKTNK